MSNSAAHSKSVSTQRLEMDTKSASANNVQQVMPTKIKLCGYLKKKRNKVGGWRKMWFVLQDKLLLSYVSKEEYDNKLVSFKDVLNLVPGTVVRPLGGFRFTIETTSQAMYTFYCDDRAAYREWISMLLLSIASQSVGAPIAIKTKSSSSAPRFANISLDNIPVALNSSQLATSLSSATSSSSITQTPLATTHSVASARLPIAHKTAKMLERNGINPLDLNTASTEQELNKSCYTCLSYSQVEKSGGDGIQEFRLHEDVAVSNPPKYLNAEVEHSVTLINRMFSAGMMEKSNCARQQDCFKVNQTISTDKRKCENVATPDDRTKYFICRNSHTNERQHMELMQESLCRLTIKGSKEIYLEMTEDWIERHNKKKLISKASKEQVLIKKKLNSEENLAVTIKDNSQNAAKVVEPVYAVVDLKNKYAQRKMRNSVFEAKRCNSYDSIIHNTYFPVQSKANLYDKEEFIKSSCDKCDIEAIYEDGDLLPKEHSTNDYGGNEEENIYEPINVTTMHKNTFLSYLNRLKINSLLQLNRIRKKNTDCNSPKHEERYFDMKNKNVSTRKSIKVRMRKLCFREYEPKPFFKHSQQPVYGSAVSVAPIKKLKTKWKSVKLGSENRNVLIDEIAANRSNKRIFGSLPHLRKTRISIFSNKHLQLLPTKDEANGKSKAELESNIESAVKLNIVESNENYLSNS